MTEAVLNALWLILAIASFGLLFRSFVKPSADRSRGPNRFQCVVALVCVLAILFPVISLTDDLHDMQAAVEDPSSSGVTVKKFGVNRQLTPTHAQHQLLFIVSLLHVTVVVAAFGYTPIWRTVLSSSGLSLNNFGRAPPPLLITLFP
jgi:hypothetical protein